jgi:hypothetical protein
MANSIPRTPLIGAVMLVVAGAASGAAPRSFGGENPPAAKVGGSGQITAAGSGSTALAQNSPPAGNRGARDAELQQLLRDLDSPCYETRQVAADRLERWVGMPEMATVLAEQFQKLVMQPELPFEVRWRIALWRPRLPSAKTEPPQSASGEELERLVRQLDDDSYSVRAGACERLKWMAASEKLAKPLMLILKRRLADPLLAEETYRRLEAIRNIAWGTWVNGDALEWTLPPVSDGQIDDWLDELSQPASQRERRSAVRCRIARQELLDVMTQDRDVPRVKAAIEARLRGKLEADASARLSELLSFTRPALVAESWSSHKQTLEQHLIVGQPMHSPMAANPSWFDSADDATAHCKSGNALAANTDYPVGVAFPAPHWQSSMPETFFDLVNLPTPRRQIAYSYYVKTDPAARLAKLSRRTLDRFLAEKHLLSDPELGMLGQLDVNEVSRFASRYFLAVDDGTVDEELNPEFSTNRKPLANQSSRFGAICAQLALDGTREAAPGLLEAIKRKKFMSPTPLSPYRLQWLAAFSIAHRDPWPGVDAWLADNIDNKETVIIDHADAAEIGASAAGLLLIRHDERPESFGLRNVVDSQLVELKLRSFRYDKPLDVERVRQWWTKRSEVRKTKPAA